METTTKTYEAMTFETLDVTHLLILCPRGFANERSVVPIPGTCAYDAERLVQQVNPDDQAALTHLVPLADAARADRSRAGRMLTDFYARDEYMDYLYCDGPLMAFRRENEVVDAH